MANEANSRTVMYIRYQLSGVRWTPLLRKIAARAIRIASDLAPAHRTRLLAAAHCGSPVDVLVRLWAVRTAHRLRPPQGPCCFAVDGGPIFGGRTHHDHWGQAAYDVYWRFSRALENCQ